VSVRPPLLRLLLVILLAPPAAAQAPIGSGGKRLVRRIELGPTPCPLLPEIAIRPGTASLLLFDSSLSRDGVELDKRERFDRVAVGEDTLALLPSKTLHEGERLRLTVRFVDGSAPAEARFLLVVVPGPADVEVDIVRSPRPSEPSSMESTGMADELQRLKDENTRLRAERSLAGLTGALAAPWMKSQGIVVSRIKKAQPRVVSPEIQQATAWSFRAATRVAVELTTTFSPSGRPWSIGGAALIGPEGRQLPIVQTWQSGPTTGGAPAVRIIVEAEAERTEAHGLHSLELREAGGDRILTFSPVTFPDL